MAAGSAHHRPPRRKRPLTPPTTDPSIGLDLQLANRFNNLATFDPDDRDAIIHILDGLITKSHVETALGATEPSQVSV